MPPGLYGEPWTKSWRACRRFQKRLGRQLCSDYASSVGLILTACGGCKGFLINILSPDYEALAAAPSAKRLVDFAKVSSGYEQITDLRFFRQNLP